MVKNLNKFTHNLWWRILIQISSIHCAIKRNWLFIDKYLFFLFHSNGKSLAKLNKNQ